MLSDKVHVLIKSLNACHVGLWIIRKFYFLSTTNTLCAPVKVSHIYRTSHLTGNCVEACLPSLHWLTSAFWCEGKMYDRGSLHFIDDAERYVASSLSVYRDASELTKKPSKWTPEEFALDHAVWLTAH